MVEGLFCSIPVWKIYSQEEVVQSFAGRPLSSAVYALLVVIQWAYGINLF